MPATPHRCHDGHDCGKSADAGHLSHYKEVSMQSSTYKDIIDEKISEWHKGLLKLEEHADSASADTKAKIMGKLEQIKSAIDEAVTQLHELDGKETVDNTMQTKDKMLKIFSSIDKDFPRYEDKTPFML